LTQDLRSLGRIRASKSREKEVMRLKSQLEDHRTCFKNSEHLFREDSIKISLKKIKHVSKDIAFAENLRKSFGNVDIFKGAGFHIKGGERIGIIGANGCGKTTLVNLLLGRDKDYNGFIRLGEWVNYSYLDQYVLFDEEQKSVMEEVLSRKEMTEVQARDILAGFQFYGEEVDKELKVLSGGERVKLYLACIMIDETDCLIMDEPTNHLDVPSKEAVEAAIKKFKGTIIAITHDRYFLTNLVTKILEIEDGKINTYEGNYEYYKKMKNLKNEQNIKARDYEQKSFDKPQTSINVKREEENRKKREAAQQEKLEIKIIELEEKIKEIEGSLNSQTSPEEYTEYASLVNELNKLYAIWA
jgi:ATP-binding cassette subfamily F protein 3